ncbi:uncharacterized protein LOC133175709 [Saccostrea echinata]|uniref:uncharacterized protein LOC133175709 n=1 Tax=Saccostrea echinata TaxID=191078 RepID=UPI002A838290|nr:uncharacterized protein LOC133175709 [Saccostrea echinata]
MADVKLPEIGRPNKERDDKKDSRPDTKENLEHLPEVKSPGPKEAEKDKETQETSLPPITDKKKSKPKATEPDKVQKQETVGDGKTLTGKVDQKKKVDKVLDAVRERKVDKNLSKPPKRDRQTEKTQELPHLPTIKEATDSEEVIAKRFLALRKREVAFKKLFHVKEVHVFDHNMLPRINPSKSNLISRLDPYTVEQGEKEMKRITRSIPSNPDSDHGYRYRKTAVDMMNPWDFLELDSVESSRRTIPRYRGSQKRRRDYPNRPPPKGSTYFPQFPNVNYPYVQAESPTRMFELDDVPKVRKQLKKKWSKRSPERVKKDYTKTKNDFYRMELDKLNEMRPTYNRPSMVNTYTAYLQNTPGSKQALDECISGIESKLLRDEANVSLLPKHPRPSLKKSHSTLTSGRSTRQRVIKVVDTPIKVVETPTVDVPRSALHSRQTIESAG